MRNNRRIWSGLTPGQRSHVAALAADANAGRLVLFMGAGVSMGAGLPSWRELLDGLARDAKLSPGERRQLGSLDPRDAGAVLARRLGEERLRDAIATRIDSDHVSLLHQLLASLPVTEALTTNYDVLFEKAWRDAGRRPSILPRQHRPSAPEWLLKLHGSVDNRRHPLVLSRDDYLRFETSGTALAGIVQAMLLTRKLLFVGYSLSDDNSHRIIHQVHDTVVATRGNDADAPAFGTVLTDQKVLLADDVWKGDLEFVSTHDSSDDHGIRRAAIFLDCLAASTATGTEHLLDRSFEAVFNEPELELAEMLRAVKRGAESKGIRPGIGRAVADALRRFGG